MTAEKTSRNQKIIAFWEKHKDEKWTFQSIACVLHVLGTDGKPSRKIVRQVIMRHKAKEKMMA